MTHPPFLPERIGIADAYGENLLIRGIEPLIGDDLHFAYKEIGDAIKRDLTKYNLVDVCLIDNVGERWAFAPEVRAFGIDPDIVYPTSYWPPYLQAGYDPKQMIGRTVRAEGFSAPGSMIWWPIEGLPPNQDPKVFLSWPGWNLSGLVDHLNDLMRGLSGRNAIYLHCMVGSDRTGAAHISYLMKWKGLSKEDAIKMSQITAAPLPRNDYMMLIDAYAHSIGK